MITATRYHDISCGHRVVGHEGACSRIHGHNYRIHFTVTAKNLDKIGRTIDFGEIKKRMCVWLDLYWDHRMLVWSQDPWIDNLIKLDNSICIVPFNPTAENIAMYLVNNVGPLEFDNTGVI